MVNRVELANMPKPEQDRTASITGIEVMSKAATKQVFLIIETDTYNHGLDMTFEQAKDLHKVLGKAIEALEWGGS